MPDQRSRRYEDSTDLTAPDGKTGKAGRLSDDSCDHDWRIDPHVVLMSLPPRYRVVCARCGKVESRSSGVQMPGDDPAGWAKWEDDDA